MLASAGDLLVQLDDAEARAEVAQARAAVDQANARVEQLRRVGAIVATEGLRQAQANLERAESSLERTQKVATSGAVAQERLEEDRRAVDVARALKAAAEAQQISSAPMGADSRVALTALLQARAQLAGANVRLAQTHVTALQDGVVLIRSVEPGDVAQPARTLLVMAVDADAQLVFHPDERNLAFIRLGQRARASADAYPQEIFDAVVSYVAPSIDPQRGSIEVRLGVPKPPAFLKPDMTVSVDLTVATKRQALTLPGTAVRAASSPAPWVWTVEAGRVVRRDVKLRGAVRRPRQKSGRNTALPGRGRPRAPGARDAARHGCGHRRGGHPRAARGPARPRQGHSKWLTRSWSSTTRSRTTGPGC